MPSGSSTASDGTDSEDSQEERLQRIREAIPMRHQEMRYRGPDLSAAFKYGASESDVLALLQSLPPEAAKEKDKNGMLPLHYAVCRGASGAVVAALRKAYPEAAKEKNKNGMLPLHCAVVKGASEALVTALLQAYPEAAKEKDNHGRLPLHYAVSKGASEALVLPLLQAYPETAEEKDKNGMLPLHYAVWWGASGGPVVAVLDAYPKAVKEKDGYGRLPLHCAVTFRASEMVVPALLRAYPEAAEEKDNREMRPLHFALVNGASEAVVLAVLHAYPEAAKEKDGCGRTPLHYALEKKDAWGRSNQAVVLALLKACPEAAMESGVPLLNCALKNGASGSDVLALLQSYPELAKEKDKEGMLPLHYAVCRSIQSIPEKRHLGEAVVLALLQAYPEAAKEEDDCERLPLHCAVSDGASEAVVAALLAADMPLRLDTGAPVDHAGSWPYAVASTAPRVIAAVGRVLASKSDDPAGQGFGAHIHALVKVRDKQKRTALEASTEEPRKAIYLHWLFCGRYEFVIGAPEHRSATSVVLRALDRGEKIDYGKIFDDADKDTSGTLEREELASVAASIGLDAELFLRTEDKSIDRSSFVGICKQQLGDGQRSVVIKLMQEEEQWVRERDARAKNQLESRFVVQELPGVPSDDEIAEAVRARGGGLGAIAQQHLPEGISLGTRAIIMDAADRNLHQIYLQERPDFNGVRAILQQVFEAVAHLHEKGLMHGDLKLLNVVRYRRDNRLRLIDLDAAAKIVPVGGEGESYAGAKFSSGVLPPEMFHELKQGEAEALDAYWHGKSKELQAKVAPKSFSERGVVKSVYVVKSFRTADGGDPVFIGLPYSEELAKASEKIDAWSLGVLAFVLLAGEPLVPSTRDDDCASGAAMRVLHAWGTQQGVVLERLEKIDNPAARDLVDKLLQREPSARLSVKGALEHVLFRTGRDGGDEELRQVKEELRQIKEEQARQGEEQRKLTEMLVVVKELSIENKRELRRTREVLLKGMFEATEVTIPTTFVVLLKKLPEAPNEEERAKLVKIAADGSGVTLGNDNFSVTFSEEMAVAGGKYVDTLNTGMKWLRRLKTIGSKVAAGKVGEAFDTINAGLGDLVTGETMYLYLIDELTGEPVRDPSGHYPIEIKTPSEVVPKLLPVMQVGLRAMSVFNGAAGVARMFGYPVPLVPEAWAAGARESVALLQRESSVEDYDVVQGVLGQDGAKKESESVRGASLRVLQRFFEKHDAKKGYAGLRRVADEDGTAGWTALTDSSAVKAAIEARAKERREEGRRGDELLQQALKLSSAPAAASAAGASSGEQHVDRVWHL